ncbi:MAG: hypothetical protein L3K02_04585, partial [Thermoplasmata archaeon]|nr:hypothetical protein [Thermoplasmata archaeon]
MIVGVAADAWCDSAGSIVSLLFDGGSMIIDGIAIAQEGFSIENDAVLTMDTGTLVLDFAAHEV